MVAALGEGRVAAFGPKFAIFPCRLRVRSGLGTVKLDRSRWYGSLHVRFGSLTAATADGDHVRFTPESGHSSDIKATLQYRALTCRIPVWQ